MLTVAYFVDPDMKNDCPVYGWISDSGCDKNSIEKIADSIEQWLSQVNFPLYIEFQARKIFCDTSTID